MAKNNILLAVDIGNTLVSFGVIKGKKVCSFYNVETSMPSSRLATKVRKELETILRLHPGLEEAVVCSVVPRASKIVETELGRLSHIRIWRVNKELTVPIENNYYNPRQVGQDRLVCAYAAKELYGAPVIIIDFGTAITFDVVSFSGAYEGGMIVPGIRLSTESLFQKTAMLPRIENIQPPRNLIGKDTRESMLSGVFYGYGMMCRGLIDLIKKSPGSGISKGALKNARVVVTGGYASLMKKFIHDQTFKVDSTLVFKGMGLLYEHVSKGRPWGSMSRRSLKKSP